MKKITEIRTYLMGMAILWIMLFHTDKIFSFPLPIMLLQQSGNYGVDIFFFVSAYGLYYSMKKKIILKDWFIRRIKRIYPTFLLVTCLTGLLLGWSLWKYVQEGLFLGFLIPPLNFEEKWNVLFWYIPAQMIFYLLFPLLYKHIYIVKKYYLFIFVLTFVIFNLMSSYISMRGWSPYFTWFVARIPVFILGLIYADKEPWIIEKIKGIYYVPIFIVGFISITLLLLQNANLLPFSLGYINGFMLILLALPFFFWICSITFKYLRIFNPIIEYCGKYSLELYLLHVAFIKIFPNLGFFDSINGNVFFLSAFLLPMPLAFALHRGVNALIK